MNALRVDALLHVLELRKCALGGEPPKLTPERAARVSAALDELVTEHAALAALAAEISADDVLLPAVRRLDVPRHLPALAAWRDQVLARSARAEPNAVAAAWEVTALQRACEGDADGAQNAKAQAERAALQKPSAKAKAAAIQNVRIADAMARAGVTL